MGVKVKAWKGAWWLFIDHQGKRKAKRIGVGAEAKKRAKKAAGTIEARLNLGDLGVLAPDSAVPTFAAVAEGWLKKYPTRRAIRPSTIENYTSFTKRHLVPFFGTMPITAITPETIEDFIEAKRAPGFALRPEDVDLERGTIEVRRTWSRGRVGPTKTGRSRSVSLLHPVTETTSEWRPGVTPDSRAVLTALRALAVQPIDPTGFLFTRH